MKKLPFDPVHFASRIQFDMLSRGRFFKKVVLVEGPSDQQFYKRMFANTVHTRSVYSRETVVYVCKELQQTTFPCYGIIDFDYYWFHSEQNPEPGNVLVLDENNLESFVLFNAQAHEGWNHSGTSTVLSDIIECAKLLGFFRCINHTHDKKWRFRPVSGSNNSTFHLRSEIRRMFAQNKTRSPSILLANLLELYDFTEPEFDARKNEILNAPNYSLSRLINGKDLNMFLSISNMPHVYQNAADEFDLEQFRNTNLGEKLQSLGVLE